MSGPGDGCGAIGELIAAYALAALDPDERAAVDEHIATCPRCSQELDDYRQTVGLLSATGGPAPEGVWERISLTIEDDTGPAKIPELPRLAGTARAQRRRWGVAARIAVAAAAVAAVTLLGLQTSRIDHLDRQVKQLNAATQPLAGSEGVVAALVDPAARHLELLASTTSGSAPVGQLVILPTGAAYLVGSRLAALPPSSTYQMWSVAEGRTVSVSLLGAHPDTVPFRVDPNMTSSTYLVTVEPAGGVAAPTTAPIARTVA